MIKVYLGLANPSLEISLQSFWFMHGLILAKQWTAEVQSYKYRDLLFGFWGFPDVGLAGGSVCFSYHSTLGQIVVLGTPSELVAEQSHPSYHRAPEEKHCYLRQQTGEIYFKGNSYFGSVLSFPDKRKWPLLSLWKKSSLVFKCSKREKIIIPTSFTLRQTV